MVSTTENREHWIVLAYTSKNEFVTWDYFDDTKYSGGHYFQNFLNATEDFKNRVEAHCHPDFAVEYRAKQIGQTEVVWENLDDEYEDHVKELAEKQTDFHLTTATNLLGVVVQLMSANENYAGMLATILAKGYTQEQLDKAIDNIKNKAAQWQE